jgi:hypothetical protein
VAQLISREQRQILSSLNKYTDPLTQKWKIWTAPPQSLILLINECHLPSRELLRRRGLSSRLLISLSLFSMECGMCGLAETAFIPSDRTALPIRPERQTPKLLQH